MNPYNANIPCSPAAQVVNRSSLNSDSYFVEQHDILQTIVASAHDAHNLAAVASSNAGLTSTEAPSDGYDHLIMSSGTGMPQATAAEVVTRAQALPQQPVPSSFEPGQAGLPGNITIDEALQLLVSSVQTSQLSNTDNTTLNQGDAQLPPYSSSTRAFENDNISGDVMINQGLTECPMVPSNSTQSVSTGDEQGFSQPFSEQAEPLFGLDLSTFSADTTVDEILRDCYMPFSGATHDDSNVNFAVNQPHCGLSTGGTQSIPIESNAGLDRRQADSRLTTSSSGLAGEISTGMIQGCLLGNYTIHQVPNQFPALQSVPNESYNSIQGSAQPSMSFSAIAQNAIYQTPRQPPVHQSTPNGSFNYIQGPRQPSMAFPGITQNAVHQAPVQPPIHQSAPNGTFNCAQGPGQQPLSYPGITQDAIYQTPRRPPNGSFDCTQALGQPQMSSAGIAQDIICQTTRQPPVHQSTPNRSFNCTQGPGQISLSSSGIPQNAIDQPYVQVPARQNITNGSLNRAQGPGQQPMFFPGSAQNAVHQTPRRPHVHQSTPNRSFNCTQGLDQPSMAFPGITLNAVHQAPVQPPVHQSAPNGTFNCARGPGQQPTAYPGITPNTLYQSSSQVPVSERIPMESFNGIQGPTASQSLVSGIMIPPGVGNRPNRAAILGRVIYYIPDAPNTSATHQRTSDSIQTTKEREPSASLASPASPALSEYERAVLEYVDTLQGSTVDEKEKKEEEAQNEGSHDNYEDTDSYEEGEAENEEESCMDEEDNSWYEEYNRADEEDRSCNEDGSDRQSQYSRTDRRGETTVASASVFHTGGKTRGILLTYYAQLEAIGKRKERDDSDEEEKEEPIQKKRCVASSSSNTNNAAVNEEPERPNNQPSDDRKGKGPAQQRQHKNVEKACVRCKHMHLRCDDSRPCERCRKADIFDCQDAPQKPRGRPRKYPRQ